MAGPSLQRQAQDVLVPAFFYGTAWKEERTEALTALALSLGFRAIDTANQRRHYVEAAVGSAIKAALQKGLITRNQLFLQSKFTFRDGQDHRLPYDPRAKVAEQVRQSFASSLDHLGTSYLDALILHGPSARVGLHDDDWEAWQAMEALKLAGNTRLIGVSNVSAEQLALLFERARVKPAIVQNRCYARMGWDREVRAFASRRGMLYQGFSLLTANLRELGGKVIAAVASRHRRTPAQVVFRFALQAGILPITGTTDPAHMQQDLDIATFELDPDELASVEAVSVRTPRP